MARFLALRLSIILGVAAAGESAEGRDAVGGDLTLVLIFVLELLSAWAVVAAAAAVFPSRSESIRKYVLLPRTVMKRYEIGELFFRLSYLVSISIKIVQLKLFTICCGRQKALLLLLLLLLQYCNTSTSVEKRD